MTSALQKHPRTALGVAAGLALLAYVLWPQDDLLPRPGEPAYEAYAEDFQVGLAAVDTGGDSVADLGLTRLGRAVTLVPLEPAGWANRAVLHMRVNKFPEAAADLAQAARLAPRSAAIQVLLGDLAGRRSDADGAIRAYRRALELGDDRPMTRFKLASALQQRGVRDDAAEAEVHAIYNQLRRALPDNLFVLKESLLSAVRRGDEPAFRETLARLQRLSGGWGEKSREALAQLTKRAAGGVDDDLTQFAQRAGNMLGGEPAFPRDSAVVNPGATLGSPVYEFLALAPLRPAAAPPDLRLGWAGPRPWPGAAGAGQGGPAVVPVWLTGEGPPVPFVFGPKGVQGPKLDLAFPAAAVVGRDLDNDGRNDLVVAGPGGVRLLVQQPDRSFADRTDKAGLPPDVVAGSYRGCQVWDIDMDGDLDVILFPAGEPVLLRNNRDGTFRAGPIFPGVKGVTAFAWADVDNDGAPDAALLDADGRLAVFANERMGRFRRREGPAGRYHALAVLAGPVAGLDLVALRDDGQVVRLADRSGEGWEVTELADAAGVPGRGPGARLLAADLDNNGSTDLLVATAAGGAAFLAGPPTASGSGGDVFTRLEAAVPAGVFEAADVDGDGVLDLVGLSGERPSFWAGRSQLGYHWLRVRVLKFPRKDLTGDDRINSFAVGGTLEVRRGTHVSLVPIDRPVVHLGLGARKEADVVRFVWPNGVAQFEFGVSGDALVPIQQRLSGSCPFLYAWDGERIVFVTDFLWSTPLGMYINAQDKGGFLQTTDWVRVRGDQLRPRDGLYDLRVGANLWETHFIDHLGLKVVDHPPGTELVVDERFFLTPTPPQVRLTTPARPVRRAWDHRGDDVTAVVQKLDGKYLDRAGRGRFQGVTADHWVEVDLSDAPAAGPVCLLARGFIHPTDSSVNFALEQGRHEPPRGLVLEVPDGKGGWRVGLDRLGFPAGKNKTVMLRLDGIPGETGVPRRARLRTNLEIYWDALEWAEEVDAKGAVVTDVPPRSADLRFAGVWAMEQADAGSPELPRYGVAAHGQRWRDLIGPHTRFGDVKELLSAVDDRYVIMNAGDEIALTFAAPPGPRAGWSRDFIWASDGWVKDGNLNTRWGKTVLPLPYHGMKDYEAAPGRLEDDPVYRRFPHDWETYHTRHIRPDQFAAGLRGFLPAPAGAR